MSPMANSTPRLGSINRSADRRSSSADDSAAGGLRRPGGRVGVAVQEDRRGQRRLAGSITGDRVEVGADHGRELVDVADARQPLVGVVQPGRPPLAGRWAIAGSHPNSPRGEHLDTHHPLPGRVGFRRTGRAGRPTPAHCPAETRRPESSHRPSAAGRVDARHSCRAGQPPAAAGSATRPWSNGRRSATSPSSPWPSPPRRSRTDATAGDERQRLRSCDVALRAGRERDVADRRTRARGWCDGCRCRRRAGERTCQHHGDRGRNPTPIHARRVYEPRAGSIRRCVRPGCRRRRSSTVGAPGDGRRHRSWEPVRGCGPAAGWRSRLRPGCPWGPALSPEWIGQRSVAQQPIRTSPLVVVMLMSPSQRSTQVARVR